MMKFKSRCTLTGLAALAMTAVIAPVTVKAQPAVQAHVALRPLTNDDVAAYKLPATTQRSGGLTTIGIGQPAYLEARVSSEIPAADVGGVTWALSEKPTGSAAVLEDSPLGTDVLIYEPSDRLAFQVAGRKVLRPDVPGRYTVTASISVGSLGTTDARMTITAATYLGIQSCVTCHGGGPAQTPWSMANSWSQTSHATIFQQGINGVNSDHYAPNCIGCHTVGNDSNAKAVNGGFDDAAAQLDWTFPAVMKAGNWEGLPDKLKNLGNIQCENCHGPGSRHVASGGDPRLISVSTDSGVCGQCHGALTHHSKSGEWAGSRHAVATRGASGAGREGCVGCHTGVGFMGQAKGTSASTEYASVNCQGCHDPHGRTTPEKGHSLLRTVASVKLQDGTAITGGGTGMLCMNCHQSRRNAAEYALTAAPSSHFGPHHGPQADMLAGTNGFTYGQTIPSSAHIFAIENTCVACHMQAVEPAEKTFLKAGGHTFNAGAEDGSDLVAACRNCHGPRLESFNFALLDYNGDGKIEGVQTEVQHLLDELALLLPPVGKSKSSLAIDASWTRPQLTAAYNWLFVSEDGSLGIHNTAYTVGLLKATIADLKASAK
jgi:hypothetical protein